MRLKILAKCAATRHKQVLTTRNLEKSAALQAKLCGKPHGKGLKPFADNRKNGCDNTVSNRIARFLSTNATERKHTPRFSYKLPRNSVANCSVFFRNQENLPIRKNGCDNTVPNRFSLFLFAIHREKTSDGVIFRKTPRSFRPKALPARIRPRRTFAHVCRWRTLFLQF